MNSVEIVPTLLVKSEKHFVDRIRKVENVVSTMQIDVIDGKFVANKTWADVDSINKIDTDVSFDVDLMVEDVDEVIPNWLVLKNVRRIIPHFEAVGDLDYIIKLVRKSGKEIGIALDLDTKVEDIENYLGGLDTVMVMGIRVGFSGQVFQEYVLDKIAKLRGIKKDLIISVDGGVKLDNVKEIVEAGANSLAIGSAIFESDNPAETIKKFKKIVNG